MGVSFLNLYDAFAELLPKSNYALLDLKWKSYSREYTMKRCGLPYFLEGGGVLNVTTVSLCDNMEILTFL